MRSNLVVLARLFFVPSSAFLRFQCALTHPVHAEIAAALSTYGSVSGVRLVKDRDTGHGRYVTMCVTMCTMRACT
jgi:hypothetical protein